MSTGSSQLALVTASSHTKNEKIVPVSNAEVDAGSHEQTTRATR
jgi:hypothetical protein